MPTFHFAFTENGPQRLNVRASVGFRSLIVKLDDVTILELDGREDVVAGREVALPDGSVLSVRHRFRRGLEIERNGRAIPGSACHPRERLRERGGVMLTLGASMLSVLPALLRRSGEASLTSTLVGLLLITCGVLTRRSRRWAFLVGASLQTLASVAVGAWLVTDNAPIFLTGFMVAFGAFCSVYIWTGARAFSALDRVDVQASSATSK